MGGGSAGAGQVALAFPYLPRYPWVMTLRELRKHHGWSQDRLASQVGVSRPFLSQVEHGRKVLPPDRAVEIARLFGLEGDALALAVGRLVVASVERSGS